MKITNISTLQEQASKQNAMIFPEEYDWSDRAVEFMIDVHSFSANEQVSLDYRKRQSRSDVSAADAMNVVVNLDYDATGSLLSALALARCGVLADAWSLIRVAFESTCYAEYFSLDHEKVASYVQTSELIKNDRSASISRAYRENGLQFWEIRAFLRTKHASYGRSQDEFYSRLSNFGTHPSPIRSGLRVRAGEPEVRMYLSVGHRELRQCLADFAATAKYCMGIPFDSWPELMNVKTSLTARYESLDREYAALF